MVVTLGMEGDKRMGKYTKIFLVVLYLFQVYIIFGEHIVETYRHFMETMSPSTTTARELVANAVLKREVNAASYTGGKMHPAISILHIPATLTLVLKDAHIINPNSDEDGPEAKDRPRNSLRRKKWRTPPNLFREIKKIRVPKSAERSHRGSELRLMQFEAGKTE